MSIAGGLALAPLAFILGLAGLSLDVKSAGLKVIKTPSFLMLMLFLLWVCVASIWSPYQPDDVLTNYIKLLIMGAVFYFSPTVFKQFSDQDVLNITRIFLAAMIIGALVVVIDIWTHFKVTLFFHPPKTLSDLGYRLRDAELNLSHAIAILVLLSAPVSFLLKSQFRNWKLLSAFFFMLITVAAVLIDLAIGVLCVAAVTMTMIFAFKFYRRVPLVILSFSVLTILFAPFLAFVSTQLIETDLGNIPASWEHRLRMWGYCWSVITENPIIGDGFDAARTYTAKWTTKEGIDLTIVSLHPHNAGIQIWTETGFVGALLASAFITTLFVPLKAYSTTPERSATVSGVMVAGLLLSSTTSGSWQSWWWGALAVSVSIIYLLPRLDITKTKLKVNSV